MKTRAGEVGVLLTSQKHRELKLPKIGLHVTLADRHQTDPILSQECLGTPRLTQERLGTPFL